MPQHIGNAGTKATVWAEYVISPPSHQVKRAKELGEFIGRLRSLFKSGEPLDVATRRPMEVFFGYDFGEVRLHYGQRAEKASRRLGARAFTFGGHIFGSRQSLDTSTAEGLGLLAHELTHTIQQTRPHQLPQGQMANPDSSSVSAAPPRGHSGSEMVLLASPKSAPLTANRQQREAQAQASEQLVARALAENEDELPSEINPEEVANKVYRLMQRDLVLERERATKLGG